MESYSLGKHEILPPLEQKRNKVMEGAREGRAKIFDDFFEQAKLQLQKNLPELKKAGVFVLDFVLTAPSMGKQAYQGKTFDGKKLSNVERMTYGITALSSGSFYACSGYAAASAYLGLPGTQEALEGMKVAGTMSWLVFLDQKGLDILQSIHSTAKAIQPKLAAFIEAGQKLFERKGIKNIQELVQKVEGPIVKNDTLEEVEELVEEEEHVG